MGKDKDDDDELPDGVAEGADNPNEKDEDEAKDASRKTADKGKDASRKTGDKGKEDESAEEESSSKKGKRSSK